MKDMKDMIGNFPSQFLYRPVIENRAMLVANAKPTRFIAIGMGGSHLAADLVKFRHPYLELTVHKDYGLPPIPFEELRSSLIILVSYSGNTEEVLDAFHRARDLDYPSCNLQLSVICCGGKLLELAKSYALPYILVPDTGIPPRSSTGLFLRGILSLMNRPYTLQETDELFSSLHPEKFEELGKNLAKRLYGKVPLIYSSAQNEVLALNWKVLLNESGNVPAFFNVFPELNHNEMNPFGDNAATKYLTDMFCFVFLQDGEDNPRVQKRMTVLKDLNNEMGRGVEVVSMEKGSSFHKAFSVIILAEWTAYYLAEQYGIDPIEVPMIEGFKKRMRDYVG